MSTKYKFRDPEKLYLVSFSVVYWLDIFIRNEYREILLDNIRYNQEKKGMEVYSWCIMTSHVHMIIEDYLYSSARDYAGENGLLKIKFIE